MEMFIKLNKTINNFSIYFMKNKHPFKEYINEYANIIHSKQINKSFFRKSGSLEIEAGKVMITEKDLNEPDWLKLVNSVIAQKDNLSLDCRKEWSAILFLRLKNYTNTVAITFGKINGILKDELIINDFGLATSKQLVESKNIKYIHVQSFDEKQTRISKQSIKLLNDHQIFSPFELNTVKNFKGKTNISKTNIELGGRIGLSVRGRIDIQNDLLNLLNDVLYAYTNRSSIEPKFKILDTINPVSDSKLLSKLTHKFHEKLERIFIGKIDSNKTRNLSIVPDINMDMNIDDFKGYYVSGIGIPTQKTLEDLDLIYIFEKIKLRIGQTSSKNNALKKIKNMEIECRYTASENNTKISFYKSLCFETKISEVDYIFTGGVWYELNKDFYKRITDKINQVSIVPALDYIKYDTTIHEDENHYNEKLIEKTNTIGLDCTKYKPSRDVRVRSNISGHSNIELADVLQQKNHTIHFIHVKKKKDASQTNHLFAQAKASAQLYINDKSNVQRFINEEVKKQKLNPIDFENPYKLQVVLAIIIPKNKKTIKNKKDLFTIMERISLYETIEILNGLGFEVVINFIDSNL